MAKNDIRPGAVCDAGPIIHLDELDSLDVISDFYPLIISKTVKTEITKHRPTALQKTRNCFQGHRYNFSSRAEIISLI